MPLQTKPGRLLQEIDMAADSMLDLATINKIVEAYSEPWRQYHNVTHILNMLDLLKTCDTSIFSEPELQALKLMIIYHDMVYKLNRPKGWNEIESAKVAEQDMEGSNFRTLQVDMVVCGIKATIDHSLENVPPVWRKVIALLIDLDLMAGLGRDWKEFSENTSRIALEYAPLYTAEEYQKGRVAWAKGFLDKERIFHTGLFNNYETEVRKSLWRLVEG